MLWSCVCCWCFLLSVVFVGVGWWLWCVVGAVLLWCFAGSWCAVRSVQWVVFFWLSLFSVLCGPVCVSCHGVCVHPWGLWDGHLYGFFQGQQRSALPRALYHTIYLWTSQ